jgi:hypothetical protein
MADPILTGLRRPGGTHDSVLRLFPSEMVSWISTTGLRRNITQFAFTIFRGNAPDRNGLYRWNWRGIFDASVF